MWPLRVLLLTSANFSKDYHLSRSAWNLFPSSLKGSYSQYLIAVRRYKSLAKVPVSCFRICARGLIYFSFSFMLQRLPNNYTQAGFHLKTILTVLFLFSLKCSPNKSLAQGGNISLFYYTSLYHTSQILHFFTNWRFAALSNSISTVFPTAFVHLTSLCYTLVLLTILQTFYYYFVCYRDPWSGIIDVSIAKRSWLADDSDGRIPLCTCLA